MEKAVIYARYSSDNQRDASIEQQVKACKEYAARQNLDVVDVYDDHAITGKTDSRPKFQQMIIDSAKGKWSYVIIYTIDRFARNRYDSAMYKHQLKQNGVKVLSAMEQITDDPTGILVESLLEGLAEYYSVELARKIKRGQEYNASNCILAGKNTIPLGYRRGADGRAELVPEEAAVVQEIFRRVDTGEPFVQIFEDLNRRGILTKHGTQWGRSSFGKLLSNERYLGIYMFAGHKTPGGMPRIIEDDLFYRVQERMKTKSNARGSRRRQKSGTYLLTGKVFCGHCKEPMVGTSGTSKTGDLHFYYACKGKLKDHNGCQKQNVMRDNLEKQVACWVNQMLSDPETIEWIADLAMKAQDDSRDNAEISCMEAQLKEATKKVDAILDAIEQGIVTPRTKERLEEAEAEEQSLKARISVAKDNASVKISREHVLGFLYMLSSGDIDDKSYQQTVIDIFIKRLFVYDDHLRICFNYTQGTDEVDIPIDVDRIGDDADSSLDISSDKLVASPHESRYTNPTLYSKDGWFVLVCPLIAV